MIRTFISVDLSDEFHERISDVQSKFKDFNSNLKFVDPLNVHITMKFLGDVPEEKLPDISNALDLVECDAFNATFQGIGAFPNPKNPKVLWIGCVGAFDNLYGSINESLSSLGLSGDDHKFTAHITFARVKYIRKKQKIHLSKLLDELKDARLGSMHVGGFQLKKSTLTPEGPQYETLHEFFLK